MNRSLVSRCVLLLVLASISACGATQDIPVVVYEGNFDNSQIDAVEEVIDDVANRWKLQVFRKNRADMTILAQGSEAFFVALKFQDDPILILTNVGATDVLHLATNDYGKLPVEELDRLARDAMESLRKKLNIELRLKES